jgi:hypothetical protein
VTASDSGTPEVSAAAEPAEALKTLEAPEAFEYAVLRAVPRVDRGEFVNVGVILYCQMSDFLGASVHVDTAKILALDPSADVAGIAAVLRGITLVCDGGPAAGRAGADVPGRRFRWLVAPRSTVVQPGPVHTGQTRDPSAEMLRIANSLMSNHQLGGPRVQDGR